MQSLLLTVMQSGNPTVFSRAFESVLAHRIDRRILTLLAERERELRYEELRKAAGMGSPQLFKECIERLGKNALIDRRLVPRGKLFSSHISATRLGLAIAQVLERMGAQSSLPRGMPDAHKRVVQRVLAGFGAVEVTRQN